MSQYVFGSGIVTFTPAPIAGVKQTPLRIATLKEVSLDISQATKELRGDKVFAVDARKAAGTISGKAKTGQVKGALFNLVMTGSTMTTGQELVAIDEVHAIPSSTAYEVTVTHAATYSEDMGCFFADTGIPLERVDALATVAEGQYQLDETSGEYTFAVADKGLDVAFSYCYTATTGKTISLTNQLMGSDTKFKMLLMNNVTGSTFGARLYSVIIPKLSIPQKSEDYMEIDLDFTAFCDAAGRVIDIFTAE